MNNINFSSFIDDDANFVDIIGDISSPFIYNHEMYGEKFYKTTIKTIRQSGSEDDIPLIISERLIDLKESYINRRVNIVGQLRTYNDKTENEEHPKLLIFVFVKDIAYCDTDYKNEVSVNAYICKQPNYRTTPNNREITDLLVAVNRSYRKTDYIPCIAWGRNARFCKSLEVGQFLRITGRLQSRNYIKQDGDMTVEKTAYEMSIASIQILSSGE